MKQTSYYLVDVNKYYYYSNSCLRIELFYLGFSLNRDKSANICAYMVAYLTPRFHTSRIDNDCLLFWSFHPMTP